MGSNSVEPPAEMQDSDSYDTDDTVIYDIEPLCEYSESDFEGFTQMIFLQKIW